jgi:hypothetical protein
MKIYLYRILVLLNMERSEWHLQLWQKDSSVSVYCHANVIDSVLTVVRELGWTQYEKAVVAVLDLVRHLKLSKMNRIRMRQSLTKVVKIKKYRMLQDRMSKMSRMK